MMQWRFAKSILCVTSVAACLALAMDSAQAADPLTPPAATPAAVKAGDTKIGVVNFRKVVETSKQGKQQQATFEGMKSQMESLLQDKEKGIKELAVKLNDADYIDGLTPDAENELKFKYRSLTQELAQAQQQFLQTLQQANVKIVQMLNEEVSEIAGEVAKSLNIDLVLNEESAFYAKSSLDLSDKVIQKLNEKFDRDAKKRESENEASKKS